MQYDITKPFNVQSMVVIVNDMASCITNYWETLK